MNCRRFAARNFAAVLSIGMALLFSFAAFPRHASALAVASGNPNSSPPANGPDWLSSTKYGRSATYLGDNWVLSVMHVSDPTVKFDTSSGITRTFEAIGGQNFAVPNPSGFGSITATSDIRLFRIKGTNGADSPEGPAVPIATTAPVFGDEILMVGNGVNSESQLTTWYVDVSAGEDGPFYWGTTPGSGFATIQGYASESGGKRWGTNFVGNDEPLTGERDSDINAVVQVSGRDTVSLVAYFDETGATADEALALPGDSGGGVFVFQDGQWKLAGVMNATLTFLDQWHPDRGVPWGAAFGNVTTFADLSVYQTAIQSIIDANPEYSISGDLDLDGDVDDDDVTAFVAGFLSTQPSANITSWQKGDLDLDGDTDLNDFILLRNAYPAAGAAAGLLGAAVPEPTTALLLLLTVAGLLGCRKFDRYNERHLDQ